MEKKSKKAFKIIMLILVVAIIAAIICYLFPVIKNLSTQEGQVAFKEKVSNSGILGFLMLFGLQFAQIFLFVIPGEPIEILSGICYGPVWGTIFIMISAAIISLLIYLLVHKFGRKFIYDFCGEERIKKIENAKAEAEVMKQQNQQITENTLKLKELEVKQKMIEKWNGTLPTTISDDILSILNK